MSRFVLDCAVSRPVSDRVARWYAHARSRGGQTRRLVTTRASRPSMLEQSAAALAGQWAHGRCISVLISEPLGSSCLRTSLRRRLSQTTAVDTLPGHRACGEAAAVAPAAPCARRGCDGRVTDGVERPADACGPGTNLANQEIGTVQRDLTAWARATGSPGRPSTPAARVRVGRPPTWSR